MTANLLPVPSVPETDTPALVSQQLSRPLAGRASTCPSASCPPSRPVLRPQASLPQMRGSQDRQLSSSLVGKPPPPTRTLSQAKDFLGHIPRDDIFFDGPKLAALKKPKKKKSFGRLLDLAKPGATKQTEFALTRTLELSSPDSLSSGQSSPGTPTMSSPGFPGADWFTEGDDDDAEDEQGPKDTSQLIWKQGSLYHKFPREDVPYMQSFSSVSLHSDYYTYDLLHRLCPKGSPTFHDYGDKPPLNVLDLGSGEGFWAAEAARVWKSTDTKITAFDIVDLGHDVRRSLDPKVAENITWMHGNCVQPTLPFKKATFDLVRIANMMLAIPYDGWNILLSEVWRILKPGGRVEIIDDDLFFPEIQHPPSAPLRPLRPHRCSKSIFSDGLRDDTVAEGTGTMCTPPPKAFYVRCDMLCDSPESMSPKQSHPVDDFLPKANAANDLETIFQNMLMEKYQVLPHAHEYLSPLLTQAFGQSNARHMRTMQIAVPKHDVDVAEVERSRTRQPSGFTVERERREKELKLCTEGAQSPVLPLHMSPKVAWLLGAKTSKSAQSALPYQPQGLILCPSTFLPCEPDVLEMHACKNIHTLLACKYALGAYVQDQKGSDGQPMLSETEFDELMWEYDTFKRQRMNWPLDYPGIQLHADFDAAHPSHRTSSGFLRQTSRPRSASAFNRHRARSTSIPLSPHASPGNEDLTIVRTIRVYEARKPFGEE